MSRIAPPSSGDRKRPPVAHPAARTAPAPALTRNQPTSPSRNRVRRTKTHHTISSGGSPTRGVPHSYIDGAHTLPVEYTVRAPRGLGAKALADEKWICGPTHGTRVEVPIHQSSFFTLPPPSDQPRNLPQVRWLPPISLDQARGNPDLMSITKNEG